VSPPAETFNRALEDAIYAAPDDLSRFDAYAAWLRQQGGPRGELAVLQLERERDGDTETSDDEHALIEEHAELLLGDVADDYRDWIDDDYGRVTWRGGFLRSIRASTTEPALAALLAHPSARLLHTLHILDLDCDECYDDVVQAILAADAPLGALRVLRIGMLPEGQSELAGYDGRNCLSLGRLAARCPQLEEIKLTCPRFGMGDFPALRILDAADGASPESIRAIAQARLPALETLRLGLCREPDAMWASMAWTADTLVPLLGGDATPNLRRLLLWPLGGESCDDLLEQIAASPLGGGLEHLAIGDADPEV